jgi:hypothetical protein
MLTVVVGRKGVTESCQRLTKSCPIWLARHEPLPSPAHRSFPSRPWHQQTKGHRTQRPPSRYKLRHPRPRLWSADRSFIEFISPRGRLAGTESAFGTRQGLYKRSMSIHGSLVIDSRPRTSSVLPPHRERCQNWWCGTRNEEGPET